MVVLVTGATGFLGRHLLKHLAGKKERVRCLARKTSNVDFIDRKKFDLVFGDITNMQSLLGATKDVSMVINLAASVSGDVRELNSVNVAGTKNLVEACRQNNVKRIIHISSLATTREPLDEYGKTKLEADKMVMESGLKWTILRPTMIYGEGSSAQKMLASYVNAIPFIIPIIGSGNYKVMPVYVEDVCSAIAGAEAAGRQVDGKIYDIAGPDKITFNHMISIFCKELGIRKIMVHIPVPLCLAAAKIFSALPGFPLKESFIKSINHDTRAEPTPAIKDLGFNPVSFEKGIRLAI